MEKKILLEKACFSKLEVIAGFRVCYFLKKSTFGDNPFFRGQFSTKTGKNRSK